MTRLSKVYPEVLFVLRGEESEDLWECYYLGGRMQETPARVEHLSFNPEQVVELGGEWSVAAMVAAIGATRGGIRRTAQALQMYKNE